MEYAWLAILAVVVVIIVLAMKIVKGMMQTLIYVVLIFVLTGGLIGYFLFRDTTELGLGLATRNTTFILKQGDSFVAGFTIDGLNLSKTKSFSSGKLDELEGLYLKKEYKSMVEESYKLVIIDQIAFPKAQGLDPDKVFDYLDNEIKDTEAMNLIMPNIDPKAAAFSMLVVSSVKQDPSFLVKEYRKDNVIVYPETFFFKLLKIGVRKDKK